MAEFASKGVAGAALGTGIAGTALGVLNGGLGNILGNGWGATNCNCSENIPVNRYELNMTQQMSNKDMKIAELETEVKLRDANFYTLNEMGKLRDYVDGRFDHVEHELCQQKVYNATNTASIGCISNQVAQLMALTKLVVPNTSVCPGWGDVTVSVTPATTTT